MLFVGISSWSSLFLNRSSRDRNQTVASSSLLFPFPPTSNPTDQPTHPPINSSPLSTFLLYLFSPSSFLVAKKEILPPLGMSSSMPFTPRASSSKHHIPASGRFRATGATLSTREENKVSNGVTAVLLTCWRVRGRGRGVGRKEEVGELSFPSSRLGRIQTKNAKTD